MAESDEQPPMMVQEGPEPAKEKGIPRPSRSLSYNFQDMLAPVNDSFADVVRSVKTGGYDADLLMAYIVALDNIIPDESVEEHEEWRRVVSKHGSMWDADGFSRMAREHYLDALHAIRNIAKSHGIVARGAAKEEAQVLDLKDMFEGELMAFNIGRFLDHIFAPGKTLIVSGDKGAGKSHMGVGLDQWYLDHRPETVLLANIIFQEMIGTKEMTHRDGTTTTEILFKEAHPDRVYKVQNFEEVFRLTGKLLEEDPFTNIILALDEVQNFMLAEDYSTPIAKAFNRYEGNTRKFHHHNQFFTPSKNNIPKRIRCFPDEKEYSGYLNAHMYKSQLETAKINQKNGTNYHVRDLGFIKMSYESDPQAFTVPTMSWTRQWADLTVGDIVYDHYSSATFDLAEFDFSDLMRSAGGVISADIPSAILSYFDRKDREVEEDKEDPAVQQVKRILRMKTLNKLTNDDIGFIEGENEATLRTRVRKITRQQEIAV